VSLVKFGTVKAIVHLGATMETLACFLRSSNWAKFVTGDIHANVLKSSSFLVI